MNTQENVYDFIDGQWRWLRGGFNNETKKMNDLKKSAYKLMVS